MYVEWCLANRGFPLTYIDPFLFDDTRIGASQGEEVSLVTFESFLLVSIEVVW
jgi:hypothetical protein